MDIKVFLTRYGRFFSRTFINFIRETKQKIFNSSTKQKAEFTEWLFERHINPSETFVPLSDENIKLTDDDVKTIAFYLPQFHETEYNNKYFGKGFMEWYNVTKAVPQFKGHYQPQLPIDVGFYNLTHDDVMYRQIELAKKYGIYGFCFYYYWFSGETFLEKPILNFLNNKELDMPFCLFWADETWTNVWGDGNHRKIIKEQKLIDGDDERFVNDVMKYFKDERYIKINGKPLMILFKNQIFPKERLKKFLTYLREKTIENGFKGIYLLTSNGEVLEPDLDYFEMDGIVEFSIQCSPIQTEVYNFTNEYINPNFKGKVLDIKRALEKGKHLIVKHPKSFKCINPGWDNSPRKAYKPDCYVFKMTPNDFKKWLTDILNWTKQNKPKEEQMVFVHAWNEWAESAHLEPDQKYGYAYLQAVKEAVEASRNTEEKN